MGASPSLIREPLPPDDPTRIIAPATFGCPRTPVDLNGTAFHDPPTGIDPGLAANRPVPSPWGHGLGLTQGHQPAMTRCREKTRFPSRSP